MMMDREGAILPGLRVLLVGLIWLGFQGFAGGLWANVEDGLVLGQPAPSFELKDAADKSYKLKDMRGSLVVLIMGNRKIRKQDDAWAEALRKRYGEQERLKIFIVADMRSVPRFIPKRLIQWQLKKNPPPVPLLLDWKGKVHQRYYTNPEKPNLFLIDPEGMLVYKARAVLSDASEKPFFGAIEAQLRKLEATIGP